MYRCAVCGAGVIVLPKLVVRRCKCAGAIVGEMRAACEGRGGVKVGR